MTALTDFEEFRRFRALLKERFPLVHAAAERTRVGATGVIYRIPGQAHDAPSVCMAHYDCGAGGGKRLGQARL